MKKIELVVAVFFAFVQFNASADQRDPLPKGGRMSTHGMVVFGSNGRYFLEHIPMTHNPNHDYQIIAEVKLSVLKSGKFAELTQDLSDDTFTLEPQVFSLNDYIRKELKEFKGTLYRGGFEQGGNPIFQEVKVEVLSFSFPPHKLSKPNDALNVEMYRVSDGVHTFESNAISKERNFQKVTVAETGKVLWCAVGDDFSSFCR